MNIQPKDSAGGSGETRESLVARQATEMLDKLPADYVPFEVSHFSSNTTYLVLSCDRSCVSFFIAFSISLFFFLCKLLQSSFSSFSFVFLLLLT